MRYQRDFTGAEAIIVFFVAIVIAAVIYTALALAVSGLVSYVFEIDFGFWKALCAVLLTSLLDSLLFRK